MRDAFRRYWLGILLMGLGVTATLWLAASGQLGLYIHPRYFVFTIVMALIAAIAVGAALVLPRARDEHEHAEHAHADEPTAAPRSRGRLAVAGGAAVLVLTAIGLLAIPPTTLSAAFAGQRELNDASLGTADEAVLLAAGDTSAFTVKDWAVLISQGIGEQALRTGTPVVTGFILPDPEAPELGFTIARYVVTCCAVDALPVGVAVRLNGWEEQFDEGQWVQVTGRFAPNPDPGASVAWVLQPTEVLAIDQPTDPYVY